MADIYFRICWQDVTIEEQDSDCVGYFDGEYTVKEARKQIDTFYNNGRKNHGEDILLYIYWLEPVNITPDYFIYKCYNLACHQKEETNR